jgi:hypothetical protein
VELIPLGNPMKRRENPTRETNEGKISRLNIEMNKKKGIINEKGSPKKTSPPPENPPLGSPHKDQTDPLRKMKTGTRMMQAGQGNNEKDGRNNETNLDPNTQPKTGENNEGNPENDDQENKGNDSDKDQDKETNKNKEQQSVKKKEEEEEENNPQKGQHFKGNHFHTFKLVGSQNRLQRQCSTHQ